jgi:hypothetical protein
MRFEAADEHLLQQYQAEVEEVLEEAKRGGNA